MKYLFGMIAASPWAAKAIFGQIAMDATMLSFAKDIGFASLVFYLIAYSLPRLTKEHREERAEWNETNRGLQEAAQKEAAENRAVLENISRDHKAASDRGHEAAKELAQRIAAMESLVKQP